MVPISNFDPLVKSSRLAKSGKVEVISFIYFLLLLLLVNTCITGPGGGKKSPLSSHTSHQRYCTTAHNLTEGGKKKAREVAVGETLRGAAMEAEKGIQALLYF